MRLGIFTKTFARPTLPAILAAVAAERVDCVQFNLACVGVDTVPAQIPAGLAATIGQQFAERQITMSAISGTFNLIHPNRALRQSMLANLGILAEACQALGTRVVTLCTGTCDPVDMWKAHPDNQSPEARRTLVESLHTALAITASTGITLAIEPEPANVVNSAEKAIALLQEINSPRLKIIFDGANLMHGHAFNQTTAVLRRALDLLAPHTVIAHAKNLEAVGQGTIAREAVLDYVAYLRLLFEFEFEGPLILHGMAEGQARDALEFVRRAILEVCTV
jgi:sugar phosphate isomerase/epimerase